MAPGDELFQQCSENAAVCKEKGALSDICDKNVRKASDTPGHMGLPCPAGLFRCLKVPAGCEVENDSRHLFAKFDAFGNLAPVAVIGNV